MKPRTKSFKLVGVMVVLVLFAALLFSYFGEKSYPSKEYSQKVIDMMNAEYQNDTYGGATPEETLKLFVDALKKGNTELASKYFLPEDQGAFKRRLDAAVEGGLTASMIQKVSTGILTVDGDRAFLAILADDGIDSQMLLIKNSTTGRWKVAEL